jgi:hypothetical protein
MIPWKTIAKYAAEFALYALEKRLAAESKKSKKK